MSIIGLAMRMAAVRALESAGTLAGPRWYDSALLPIDKLVGDTPQPFGSVATEDENDAPAGRDLNAGTRTIELVIEIGIAEMVALPTIEGEPEIAAQILSSDANLELSLAIFDRQIRACLWGRGGGLWGDAFRMLAGNVTKYAARRGIPVKDGQRFAARQLIFTIQPCAEPPFGAVVPGSPLEKFFEAADAAAVTDPAFAAIVAIIRNSIEGEPMGWPEFYTQAALDGGYTEAEGATIGIVGDPLGEPLTSISTHSGGAVIDAATIAAQLPEEPNE